MTCASLGPTTRQCPVGAATSMLYRKAKQAATKAQAAYDQAMTEATRARAAAQAAIYAFANGPPPRGAGD